MNALSYNDLAEFENVEVQNFDISNFSLSFALLPKVERIAIQTIYVFCSYIDDIVDKSTSKSNTVELKMSRLNWWENVVDQIYQDELHNTKIDSLARIIRRYNIPKQYILTLIDGCRQDLTKFRYATFNELKDYCYSVASVVGLMSIEIFGHKYEETKQYAVNLGYALQLTNILRDIKSDKDRGYIYIPIEDFDRFGYTENELLNEVYNDNFIELMRFQSRRAKEYYHKARHLLRPDERLTTFSAGIMDEIYFRILEKIELSNYNIFKKKIRVSKIHKLMITIKHWLSLILFIKPRRR